MTDKAIEKKDAEAQEDQDEQKKILDAINEKFKDNLAIKAKLLALNNYAQKEKEQSDQMDKETDVLSLKYKKRALPLIAKSNEIINGKKLQEEDVKNFDQYLQVGESEKKDEILSKDPKPIEHYWLKTLKGNFIMKEEIKSYDEEPLKALKKVEVVLPEDVDHPHNFTLKFHFDANDYFDNDLVIKEFQMKDEREASKTECTELKWKEGKDVTKKTIKKKQKNKKSGATRTVSKTVDQQSFFTFFRNMEQKEDEEEEDEDEEEEKMDDIDRHVEIAFVLLEEILPYSSEYYLGVRKDPTFGFPGMELGEDDDEDDDDDEEGGKPGAGKRSTKGMKVAGGDPKQECKQQ